MSQFPPEDPREDCGPAECIRHRDHTPGDHFKWKEGSEFANPAWRVSDLQWTSGVSEELAGDHPGRHQLDVTLWSSSEEDAQPFSLVNKETLPPKTYRELHKHVLLACADRLRQIAAEMETKAQRLIESQSGVVFPGDKPQTP